jgi:dihydroorotase
VERGNRGQGVKEVRLKNMSNGFYIKNAQIVNEGKTFGAGVIVRDGVIKKILKAGEHADIQGLTEIDAKGKYLIPGVIDDQVHFREPGLTHKGDIYSESRAAVAGGVTSFMEMPNTSPQTLTQELLEDKYRIASEKSFANYSFYMGASNDNLDEILKTDPENVCGLKVFMGASTGNMLVDNPETLENIFSQVKLLIATHCEDEPTIRANMDKFREMYGEDVPIQAHPLIRSEEACYRSSTLAVQLAKKYNARLHVLHLSTAHEMALFTNDIPLKEKKITAEVCVHHLWFSDMDYEILGNRIKWNPAIKSAHDRESLWKALLDDRIDIIATDHAPHTIEEKANRYFKAPSGGPLVQHSLPAMLDFWKSGRISIERVVEKMCHAPADCFRVDRRGYIREGYWADLVLIEPDYTWEVMPLNIYYKCGWSPFEGHHFKSRITHTFVSGNLVYEAEPQILKQIFNESVRGMRLRFNQY